MNDAPLRISDFYTPRPVQRAFHESGAKYRAQIGGFGSGKSRCLLMEAIVHCLTVPGCNCLIIRRTHRDLQKTIINLLLNPTEAGLGISLEKLDAKFNKAEYVAYFNHGNGVQSKLFFGYCDEGKDVNQYLSTEYLFIGVEEAGEFPFPVWTALMGRNRCPIKTDIFGRTIRPTMGLATNPFGIGYGWIKKLFVQKEAVGGMTNYDPAEYFMVHSTLYDNPTYANDTDYIASLESLPEAEKRKKLYGDLETVSGQYYINFCDDPALPGSHVVQDEKIQFHPWHPRWVGQDYGFAGPESYGSANVVLWCAKADVERFGQSKTVNVVYREMVTWGQTEKQIAEAVRQKMTPGEQITNIFFSHEQFARKSSHRTVADQYGDELVKLNLPRPLRSDTDREGGFKLIYNLFESGDLVVSTACPQLIKSIPLWVRDDQRIGDIVKTSTLEDDFADAFRYAIKGYISPGRKPLSVEKDEMLAAQPSNGDKQIAEGKPANINPVHIRAAQHFRAQRPWATKVEHPTECPGCGEPIKKNMLRHTVQSGGCGYIAPENRQKGFEMGLVTRDEAEMWGLLPAKR